MVSKAKIKEVKKLEQKKFRKETGCFVAEGPKVVGDLIPHLQLVELFATQQWFNANSTILPVGIKVSEINDDELRQLSFLQHPQQVLAIFRLPQAADADSPTDSLCIALDGVQDPGNLGTIIRIADWFGITTIYCSDDTVDAWNPKTVQATMGSLARVNIVRCHLINYIKTLPVGTPVYGTLLDGDNIYEAEIAPHGLLVMGNEGKGLSPEVREQVTHRLLIPSFPADRETAESLNVAIATAVTCAEFRRRCAAPAIP